jgi:ribonuclease P protein component
MLPYKNRLIKRADFEKVYKYGRFFYFGNVSVKAKENGLEEARIGFSVGTKFSKKAVERNRAKRQLREIFHKMLDRLKKGNDIVVIVKKGKNGENSRKKTEEAIEETMARGNLINSNKN